MSREVFEPEQGSSLPTKGNQSTLTRRIGIRLFSFILSAICRTPRITDPTSGSRVMNHRAIGVLSHRYSEDYPEVEALVVAHRAGVHMASDATARAPACRLNPWSTC